MTETRKSTDKDKELPKRDNFQKNPYITRVINGDGDSLLNHNEEYINPASKKWFKYFIVIVFAILFLIVLLQGKEIRKIKETLKHSQGITIENSVKKVVPDKKR
jgi:hypothetical protein